jgi:hypothetical protein
MLLLKITNETTCYFPVTDAKYFAWIHFSSELFCELLFPLDYFQYSSLEEDFDFFPGF